MERYPGAHHGLADGDFLLGHKGGAQQLEGLFAAPSGAAW